MANFLVGSKTTCVQYSDVSVELSSHQIGNHVAQIRLHGRQSGDPGFEHWTSRACPTTQLIGDIPLEFYYMFGNLKIRRELLGDGNSLGNEHSLLERAVEYLQEAHIVSQSLRLGLELFQVAFICFLANIKQCNNI